MSLGAIAARWPGKGDHPRPVAHAAGGRLRRAGHREPLRRQRRSAEPRVDHAGPQRTAVALVQLDGRARGADRRGHAIAAFRKGEVVVAHHVFAYTTDSQVVETGSSPVAARQRDGQGPARLRPGCGAQRLRSDTGAADLPHDHRSAGAAARARRRPRLGLRGLGRRGRARPGRHQRAGARPRRLRRGRRRHQRPHHPALRRTTTSPTGAGRGRPRRSQVDLARAGPRAGPRDLSRARPRDSDDALHRGAGPGHHVHALHDLRPAGPHGGHRPARTPPVLPAAPDGWSTTPPRSGASCSASCPRRCTTPGSARSRSRRWGSPTSARRRWCGTGTPACRSAARSSGRTPARPGCCPGSPRTSTRRSSATSAACRWSTTSPARRSAGCWTNTGLREQAERGDLLFGTMDTWIIWNLTGGVEGRAARHRRHQRQPHHADEPRNARLGRPAAGRHAACRARCCRPSRRPWASSAPPAIPSRGMRDQRDDRRPAGVVVRADGVRGRRSQVHPRNRQLPAAQHGPGAGPLQARDDHHHRLPVRGREPDLRAGGFGRGHRRHSCSGAATTSG